MVRRFVAAGHEVDVLTSDAHDLRYFTDPTRRRVDAPAEEVVDGARVRRFAVRHVRGQRYLGRLLSYVPHWPTRCRFESFFPILPGLEDVRGDYDAVFAVGYPFTGFAYAAYRTARACGGALAITPFLHLSTPGDALHRLYTREHGLRLLREADLVISPTRMETTALAAFGVPESKRLVLPMAIDRADVTGGDGQRLRARLRIPAAARLVGQLGALDPDKGTNDLVRAVAGLNAGRATEERIWLVLAGNPSPAFERLVAELPAESRTWLHVLGPIPASDVPDFYDALDVFAMPSRTDSFGIVYLEAWANRKPVIAAAAGGVVEVVRDGVTGLLVPFGDIEALTAAVARLTGDPGLAERLGGAGAAEVAAGCTWDHRFATLSGRVGALVAARARMSR